MMTVYHGGYTPIEKPEIRMGRNTKDFGPGFYCTIIKEQAQRWARRYNTKIVSIYEVCMDTSLDIKEFREMSEEWLDFIIACRSGKAHSHDIVIGQWQMIRFIIIYRTIWMELLQENSFGYWQNSSIPHIRLIFVRRMH